MKRLSWIAPVVIVVGVLVFAALSGDSDQSDAARSKRIASALRCPVCQGLSVADSPSPQARGMYDEIKARVKDGQSADEIKAYYVGRYGEFMLLSPANDGVGALVWALPVVALVLGGGGLALAFRRWRRQPALTATDDDRALVEQARAKAAP